MIPSRVLVYHKVTPRFEWGLTRVTPSQFESHVRALSEAGFRLVTLSEWYDNPQDTSTVALTFDDAYESIYHYALPVLEKYNAGATIFVISDFIGQLNTWDFNVGGLKFRHLNEDQIREIVEKGHEIGSHTRTHQVMVEQDEEYVLADFRRSKASLEELTGQEVRFLAYPFGRFSKELVELTTKAGYDAGCIFIPYNHHLLRNDSRVVYRQGVYLTDSTRNVLGKVQPGLRFHWNRLKQNVINWAAGGTIIVNSFRNKNKS